MKIDLTKCTTVDYERLFEICSGLDSLNIVNIGVDATKVPWWGKIYLNVLDARDYNLYTLSLSHTCGMSLDPLLRQIPDLKVLNFYPPDEWKWDPDRSEDYRLNELAKLFPQLRSLRHLDLSVHTVHDETLSNVLKQVRHLRSFNSCYMVPSLPDLRPHYSTLTTISGPANPEFWQEIMTSHGALVIAKRVVLFWKDIIGNSPWVTTRLEQLDLIVKQPAEELSRQDLEIALFRKITALVQLNHLKLAAPGLTKKVLQTDSWIALSKLNVLTSLRLSSEFQGVGWDNTIEDKIKRLKALKQLGVHKNNYATQDKERLQIRGVELLSEEWNSEDLE